MFWNNFTSNFKFARHISQGYLSGFSSCCILWFFIANIPRDFLELIFNRHFYNIKKLLKDVEKYQHKACPICRLRKIKMKYYTCPDCNWKQLTNNNHYNNEYNKCNLCELVMRGISNKT